MFNSPLLVLVCSLLALALALLILAIRRRRWARTVSAGVASSPSEPAPQESSLPLIELNDVYKSFGSQKVLNRVSLKIQRAETLGILGMSGGGKSVMLQLIVGLLWPDQGEIRFKGRSLEEMSESDLLDVRRRVSYVFQSGAVFDFLSVGENIAFPLRERGMADEEQIDRRVEELLDAVELEGMGDQEYDELSLGSKKQVAIARAIATNPEAILYDEPTTGVDPMIGKTLSRLIRKLNLQNNLTSVVVTHDLQCLATVSDRIILLKDGRIHFEGDLEALYSSSDPFVQAFITGRHPDGMIEN
ncbi:MAG: ATP-binding cassette domain-containing protein [Acidobacteriota bacterium]|nr:ATP-binding cassette domain-containing protein [Acidobacteriota bacterium]